MELFYEKEFLAKNVLYLQVLNKIRKIECDIEVINVTSFNKQEKLSTIKNSINIEQQEIIKNVITATIDKSKNEKLVEILNKIYAKCIDNGFDMDVFATLKVISQSKFYCFPGEVEVHELKKSETFIKLINDAEYKLSKLYLPNQVLSK